MQPDCTRCGAALVADRLDCPSCHALVHAGELKSLAAEAEAHVAAGRAADATAIWERMLALLPPVSRQHALLRARIVPAAVPPPATREGALGPVAAIGALVLGLWKLKAFVPMLATMLLSFGAYWTAFGWQFAAGLVLSIWVHEMGHVISLRRHGIAASLPMFIPGIGAYVRLKQPVPDASTDAQIGLAGPIAGALAAVACFAIYFLGGGELWLGLTQTGAIINLFNLTPLFQLDGARAFRAMSTPQRAAIALTFAAGTLVTDNTLLWLPLIGALLRLLGRGAPPRGDLRATFTMLVLAVALVALAAAPLHFATGSLSPR